MRNGDGSLQAPVATALNLSFAGAIADVNSDKKADLLVTLYDSLGNASLNILLGNGDGTHVCDPQAGAKWVSTASCNYRL
jgi:hypothetical protein